MLNTIRHTHTHTLGAEGGEYINSRARMREKKSTMLKPNVTERRSCPPSWQQTDERKKDRNAA